MQSKKRMRYNYTEKTFSARFTPAHTALLNRAIQAAQVTISDYVRRTLLRQAADDLGETMPDLSVYNGDEGDEDIEAAAHTLGMTKREFLRRTAHEAALKVLEAAADPPTGGSRTSGTRKKRSA